MILFNTGDSHTYPGEWCPTITDHYWYNLAFNHYGCTEFINDSIPGRSNDMMIKQVIKHCLEHLTAPTIYIINITTIFRFDLSNPKSDTLHNILTPEAINKLDFETIECTLYAHLIGLIEFLKSRNKDFLIINNGKNFSDSQLPMRDAYIKYFKQEPRILNWFNNSRIDFQEHVTKIAPFDFKEYGWNGHDGPEGHYQYYKMLCTRLPSQN
jgi:hypothetical protein